MIYMMWEHEVYPGWETLGQYFKGAGGTPQPPPPGATPAPPLAVVGYWYNLPWSTPGHIVHENRPGQQADNTKMTELYAFEEWNDFGKWAARGDEFLQEAKHYQTLEHTRPWHNYIESFLVPTPFMEKYSVFGLK